MSEWFKSDKLGPGLYLCGGCGTKPIQEKALWNVLLVRESAFVDPNGWRARVGDVPEYPRLPKQKEDWKDGEEIFVRDFEEGPWLRKHFAEFAGNVVFCWASGRTRWTAGSLKSSWRFYRAPTEEELKTSSPP